MKTRKHKLRPRDLRYLRAEPLALLSSLAAGRTVRQTARAANVHEMTVVLLINTARRYFTRSRLEDLRNLPDNSAEAIREHLATHRRW